LSVFRPGTDTTAFAVAPPVLVPEELVERFTTVLLERLNTSPVAPECGYVNWELFQRWYDELSPGRRWYYCQRS